MPTLTVIGGANIDLQGFPDGELLLGDSNPGRVRASPGGVGRNIAENLARLGDRVRFISVFGDDGYGALLRSSLEEVGVDLSVSITAGGRSSSVYLCILDRAGRLSVAVSDMELLEGLSPTEIDRNPSVFEGIGACVLDTNLAPATIERVIELVGRTPVVLDTVSVAKAKRAASALDGCFAVKPNRAELEELTGMRVDSDRELDRAAGALHERGIREVFVSLGPRGLYFSDPDRRGTAGSPPVDAVNVSGAGDAVTAAIADGISRRRSIDEIARFAVACATETAEAVSPVSAAIGDGRVRQLAERVRIDWR